MKKQNFPGKLYMLVHPALSIAAIGGVIAVVIIIMDIIIWKSQRPPYQNQPSIPVLSLNPTKPITDLIPLTPTILPALRQGWMTFVYPDPSKKYTFDIPSTWKASISKRYPDWITVIVGDGGSYPSCLMSFSREANDAPISGTYVSKEQEYGGRKVNVKTYYKNNTPYVQIILFEDALVQKDPFTFIEASFPLTNTDSCQQQVDQILSSLKFYY